ncbi:MAG TPA: GNAT family N-acetyltransferase [Capsulimonadaceae bacterium]|jgi:predicted acetyltransferase
MEIRLLTGDDKAAHAGLMAEAFARGQRPADLAWDTAAEPAAASPRLGAFDGTRLVAALTTHPLTLGWGSHSAPCGGVAGVACTADMRGAGLVRDLLTRSLVDMYDAGQYLSGLYPFAYAFYRRSGWEWVGEKRTVQLPLSLLKSSPETRCVRMHEGLDAVDAAKVVYGSMLSRYRGMMDRAKTAYPDYWKLTLDHKDAHTTYVHIYEAPDTGIPEGYLVFIYPVTGDKVTVPEFFAATPRAYHGLLGILHNYGTQLKTVEWNAPADDRLPQIVMNHDLETKIKPLFMGRIVDVVKAFEANTAPASAIGTTVVAVSDDTCGWNNAAFRITAEAGHVTAVRTTETPHLSLDIQALTQAYWGQPSLSRLRWAGRIDVHDESAYSFLETLLPEATCYLADFF